jgi:hypothetical protein
MVTHAETGLEAMIAPSLLPPPIHKQSCTAITRAWLHAVLRKRQGTLNRASVYSDSTDESGLTFEMPPGTSTAAAAAAAAAGVGYAQHEQQQQHRQYSNSTVDSDGSSRERSMAFYIAPAEADDDQFAEHALEKALAVCEQMGLKGFMGPCAVCLRWTQRRLLLNDDAAVNNNSSTSASNSNTATPTGYSSRLHSAAFGGRVAVGTPQTAPPGSTNGRSGGGSPIKRRLSVGLSFTSLEQHNSGSGAGAGHMSRAEVQRRTASAVKAGKELAAAMKQAFALGLVEDLEALANESEAWEGLVPPAPQPSSATTYTHEVETPPSPIAAALSSALSSTLPLFRRRDSSSEVVVEGSSSVHEKSASNNSFFAQAAQKAQARVGRLRAGSLLARMHLSRGLASKLKGITSSSSSRRRRHSIADTEPVSGNDDEPVSTSGSITGSQPFGEHTSARSSLLRAHSSSRAALLREAASGNADGGSGSSDAELLATAAAARERRLYTTAGYELTGLATQPIVAAARAAVVPLDAAYFADRNTAAQHLRGALPQDTGLNTAAVADNSKELQAVAAAVAVARLSNASAASVGSTTSAAGAVARRAPFIREPAGSSTWVVREDSGLPYENCNEEAPRLNSTDNDTIDGTDDQLDADSRLSVLKSTVTDDSYSASVQRTEDSNDVAAALLQQQQYQSEVDGVDDAAYATMQRMPRHGKLRPLQYTPQQR